MVSASRYIILFLLILVLVPNSSWCQTDKQDKEIKVALRKVGHQLLLKLGDSTSRVLPIEKYDSAYSIRFENELSFNPEDVSIILNNVLIESSLDYDYIAEVKSCLGGEISHSFQHKKNETPEELACALRTLPKDCYLISVTFTFPEAGQEEEQGILFYILLLVFPAIIIGILVYWIFKKNKKENPHCIELGKFQFDKLNTELILKEQRIELTSKEADLLELLHENVNQTVERDTILHQVWGDEGDYIGRTLDVFISKLRKKLEADQNIKIVNVRGVGYKLIVNQN